MPNENSSPEAWNEMIQKIRSGETVEVTEDTYERFLGDVPPLSMGNGGFVCGEPYNHTNEGVQYYAFFQKGNKFFGYLKTIPYKKPV